MNKRIFILFLGWGLVGCLSAPAVATPAPVEPTWPVVDSPAPPPAIVMTDTPLPSPVPPTSTVTALPPTSTATAPATVALSLDLPVHNPYAVILVAPNDVLNIRSGPGVGYGIIGTLPATGSGVLRTGPAVQVGEERWVEVQRPGGGSGWVNFRYLTEQVSPTAFCGDARVNALLETLQFSIVNEDRERFASLVSPAHGVDVRLWRHGTVANYTPAEAAWAFQSDYVVRWGPQPGSGLETIGTFRQQILPRLQEVFGGNFSLHCNDPLDLATFTQQPWPPEYTNIHFYTVYKPGSEAYGGLDWRAWMVGIEYVQGSPTLFALIHFQWEP